MPPTALRSHYPSRTPVESRSPEETIASEILDPSKSFQANSLQFKKPSSREVAEIAGEPAHSNSQTQMKSQAQLDREEDRLLNARQVAIRLGVSERFIRDHTTRRLPKIPALKLGKLIRYRRADVDLFMMELMTFTPSRRSRIDV
jgi:predicted DNA-binding transcriptional regulator AlpA